MSMQDINAEVGSDNNQSLVEKMGDVKIVGVMNNDTEIVVENEDSVGYDADTGSIT